MSRRRGGWRWVRRCLLGVALLPVLILLGEHVRGRIVLRRVLAEHGIPVPGSRVRWNDDNQRGGQCWLSPQLAEVVWISGRVSDLSAGLPESVVEVGSGRALPLSEFDWWKHRNADRTNSWELLLGRWDRVEGAVRKVREVVDGSWAGGVRVRAVMFRRDAAVCVAGLQSLNALAGLRWGRPEAVLESLEVLQSLEAGVQGPDALAIRGILRSEQERLRLAAVLARPWDAEFLGHLMPRRAPVEVSGEWVRHHRRIRDEVLGELMNASSWDACLPTGPCVQFELTDLANDLSRESGIRRGMLEGARMFDRVAEPVWQRLLPAIWRFGWGDLALAEYLRETERTEAQVRRAAAERSVRVLDESPVQRTGLYAGWISHYVSAASLGGLKWNFRRECVCRTRSEVSAAGIALERYRLRHGGYPERLDQLMPEFLDELPWDYMRGMPVRYRPAPDGSDGFDLWGGVERRGEPRRIEWPSRGTAQQRARRISEEEQRWARLAKPRPSNPYGMDPRLMRRYGLIPKVAPAAAVVASVAPPAAAGGGSTSQPSQP